MEKYILQHTDNGIDALLEKANISVSVEYVDNSIANVDFSNVLTQNGTTEYQPTEANDVTTKQYVDEAINNAVTINLMKYIKEVQYGKN